MSTSTTAKCDTCGNAIDYQEAHTRWYKLEVSRDYSEAKISVHACSPKCAAPLLVKAWEAIAKDAEQLARKSRDAAAVAKALSDRDAGARLLGAALAEVLGGASS